VVKDRLVRVRYQEMSDGVIVQAWVTEYGSVVICVDSELPRDVRAGAVRQALRAIGSAAMPTVAPYGAESNAETTNGPTVVTVQADPFQAVRDDPSESYGPRNCWQ